MRRRMKTTRCPVMGACYPLSSFSEFSTFCLRFAESHDKGMNDISLRFLPMRIQMMAQAGKRGEYYCRDWDRLSSFSHLSIFKTSNHRFIPVLSWRRGLLVKRGGDNHTTSFVLDTSTLPSFKNSNILQAIPATHQGVDK